MPIAQLVLLIAKYANYLYLICLLLLISFLGGVQKARRDRQSIFPLEKESATKRLRRALLGVVLVLSVAGGIYYISSYAGPTVTQIDETPTPTATTSILYPTPTGTPAPPTEQEVEPTDTPTPAVVAPDCPNPGVRIASPGVNAVLKGNVEIRGSANIDNFDYYKFEFQSLDVADEWHHIYTGKQPVSDGVLGYWNVDPLPAGFYLFQLVVVNISGNYPPPCQVRVSVEH